MAFKSHAYYDHACLHGSGLIEGEASCIFPSFYNGKKYNECIQFDESDFAFPVFRCPTRNITTKIENIKSYTFADVALTGEYCLLDYRNGSSDLDPTI